MSNIAEKAKIY